MIDRTGGRGRPGGEGTLEPGQVAERDARAAAEDSTRHIHFQVTPCRVLPHSVQITEPDGRTVQMNDTARSVKRSVVYPGAPAGLVVPGDPRRGVLDPRWTAWFEGLAIGSDDSQTVIFGPVADQAALHGLLNRVCDLGLVLISVRRLGPD